jgi:hypothetical protein
MRVDGGGGGRSSKHGQVGLVSGLLLFLVLFAQEAISRLVHYSSHVVLAPMEGVVPSFLFLGFSLLG